MLDGQKTYEQSLSISIMSTPRLLYLLLELALELTFWYVNFDAFYTFVNSVYASTFVNRVYMQALRHACNIGKMGILTRVECSRVTQLYWGLGL